MHRNGETGKELRVLNIEGETYGDGQNNGGK